MEAATKTRVQGLRNVAINFVTSTTVKSTIHNVLPVSDDSISLRLKAKTRLHAKHCWWFVITGTEETILTMEANWNRMTLQTGWKLQPCSALILSEGDNSAPATSNEVAATINNAPAAAIHTTDPAMVLLILTTPMMTYRQIYGYPCMVAQLILLLHLPMVMIDSLLPTMVCISYPN